MSLHPDFDSSFWYRKIVPLSDKNWLIGYPKRMQIRLRILRTFLDEGIAPFPQLEHSLKLEVQGLSEVL